VLAKAQVGCFGSIQKHSPKGGFSRGCNLITSDKFKAIQKLLHLVLTSDFIRLYQRLIMPLNLKTKPSFYPRIKADKTG
jgi:hypothetical protein